MESYPLQDQPSSTDRNLVLPSDDDICFSSRYTSTPVDGMCKKHPGKPSCYFISEQPWIQFCSKCALNMALCGKKIERKLSEDERRRKLQLQGIVFELKSKSRIAQQKQAEIKAKITIVESEYLVQVENLLRFYDSEIEEWTRKRNQVYKSYSQQILDYFKSLEEVRYRFSLSAMELKNSLQNIQGNFVAMIHQIPLTDFQQEITMYRKNLDRVIDNQDKVAHFDKKRETFDKLLKEVTAKTDAFKLTKRWLQPTSHNNSMTQHIKIKPQIDCADSRKQEHSYTPQKRSNGQAIQDQNFFSRDEELKLRLKPTNQVVCSNSKTKLATERSKRTNSKLVAPGKDEPNTSRVHRA